MFANMFLEINLRQFSREHRTLVQGSWQTMLQQTRLNTIVMAMITLFRQIEVTTLIQDVVAIFSFDCFLHHKEGLKWASML